MEWKGSRGGGGWILCRCFDELMNCMTLHLYKTPIRVSEGQTISAA